jgi:hypothetical protein
MSVYGYSIEKQKVKFNIHFSSVQTSSYTGTRYNAIYSVNLRGHLDVSDFQKSYDVRIILDSEPTSDATSAGINPSVIHCIHLDLGNKINVSAFKERVTPHFIAFKTNFNDTTGLLFTRFDTRYGDNAPIRVNSLYGVDTIGFNLFETIGQTSLTNSLNYNFILAFEEV